MYCSQCKRELDEYYFYPRKNRKKQFSSWCKDCLKVHRDKYAERAKIVRRIRTYNITERELDNLYNKQSSKCAICGIHEKNTDKKSLCVDHDHTTGKIRGLLCDDCNVALGRFKDNIDNLKNAIRYLTIYFN